VPHISRRFLSGHVGAKLRYREKIGGNRGPSTESGSLAALLRTFSDMLFTPDKGPSVWRTTLGGPERAGAGGSIPSLATIRINHLAESGAVILRGHSYSFLVNS